MTNAMSADKIKLATIDHFKNFLCLRRAAGPP